MFVLGGILALDGVTGNTLWQRWTPSIVFSLMCQTDLNKDNQIDCIASGRGGVSAILCWPNVQNQFHTNKMLF